MALATVSTVAQPVKDFNRTFGGSQSDTAYSVAETTDGGMAIGARTLSFGTGTDMWLIKTDTNGNEVINKTFGGGRFDQARSVIQTSDGGYALAGQTESFGDDGFDTVSGYDVDAWLIKTDSNGNVEINETFGGPKKGDIAYSVEQTSDGGFVLGGEDENGKAWLLKTDKNGNEEINKTYGGPNDGARSVIQTSDGGYALAGVANSFVDTENAWLLKTDDDGNEVINETFGGSFIDQAYSVVETSDGGFAIGGWTGSFGTGNGVSDAWLIKTDENGNEEFNKTYGGTSNDKALSVLQTFGGGYALAGETESFIDPLGSDNAWLVKAYENGTEKFNKTFGGTGTDGANSVAQTPNGSFALAGRTESFGSGNGDAWLIKDSRVECFDTTGDGDPDSDNDSLCDNWEKGSVEIDGEPTDLNLSAMGADPNHTDIFVEIDYMEPNGPERMSGTSHKPRQNSLQNVQNAFSNAPVGNPSGNQGINLHLRVDSGGNNLSESQELDHHQVLNFSGEGPAADFDNVKDENFGAPNDTDETHLARRLTHRYGIFAHRLEQGSLTSGRAEDIPGNDFVVTLGRGGGFVGTRIGQQSTLMHELGHTLGLRHGGGDNRNCKPNYLSVMSYSLQFRNNIAGRPLDYSRRQLPMLNESNLSEPVGVQSPVNRRTLYDSGVNKQYIRNPDGDIVGTRNADNQTGPANGPIDWNNDTDTADNGVSRDINWIEDTGCLGDADRDGNPDGETILRGHNDWANLEYNFRGTSAFADGVHPTPPSTQEQPNREDPPMLTVDTNVSSFEIGNTTRVLVNVTSKSTLVANATVNVTGAEVSVTDRETDANGTALFTLTPNESGNITVAAKKLGFLPSQTVVKSEGCPVKQVICDYGDESGNVALSGLQDAIDDFIQNSISLSDLQAIINAFISS